MTKEELKNFIENKRERRMVFTLGLSYMVFIMPTFWRVFIRNGWWILSKAFCTSTERVLWFLFFSLLMWCITIFDLQILKNACIPEINPTWLISPLIFMICFCLLTGSCPSLSSCFQYKIVLFIWPFSCFHQ